MCAFCAEPVEVSGSITLASDGISKGASETDEKPQAVGQVQISKRFLIAGAKLKNVTNSAGADYQSEFFIGIASEISGVELEITATRKTKHGATGDNGYLEVKTEVTYDFGATQLSGEIEFTPDNAGGTEAAWWGELSLVHALNDKWSLTGGIGGRRQTPKNDYAAWNAGVRYNATPNTRLELRAYDTDSDQPERDARVVASVRQSF
jgi:uncharacterized protein (TIGR02001 family)